MQVIDFLVLIISDWEIFLKSRWQVFRELAEWDL